MTDSQIVEKVRLLIGANLEPLELLMKIMVVVETKSALRGIALAGYKGKALHEPVIVQHTPRATPRGVHTKGVPQ